MQPSQENMSKDTSTREFTVERLTKEGLKDLESLYGEVYGRSAPKDYFTIKYNSEYTGHEFLGFIAYNKDRIPVAYYGVIPCFLQCGGEKIIAAQSADTMTHPEFRYKGMFVELSNITFDLCKQVGIRLIFGFPNQNSYHGAVHKLGWKMTDTMECFIIPVNTLPVARLSLKTKATSFLYQSYRQRIIGKYKRSEGLIPNSVINDGFCGLHRNIDYEQTKNYHQRAVLKFEGGTAWCKISDELTIGDLNIVQCEFESLIRELKAMAAKLGIRQMQFHTSTGTSLHALFAAKYQAIPSFPVLFQQFDEQINISNIKFTLADIDIF